ncbi:hypothetical protein JHW43_009514 [Diplocarpon mali]|nr:hypothetical protein JHW43_009514 [Diplocarpon mali]
MSGATNPSPKGLSHSSKTYPIGAGPEVSGPVPPPRQVERVQMPRLAPVRVTRPRLSSTSTPWTHRNSAPSLLLSPSMFRGREQRLGRRLASDPRLVSRTTRGHGTDVPEAFPVPGPRTRRAGCGFISRLWPVPGPARGEQGADSSLDSAPTDLSKPSREVPCTRKKRCAWIRGVEEVLAGAAARGKCQPGPATRPYRLDSAHVVARGRARSQEPGTHGETRVCSGLSGGEEEGEGLLEKRRAGPPKARAGLRGREGCDARWRWNRSGTPYRVMCSNRPPHGECTGGWESAGWLVTRHAVLRGNRHTGRTGMSRRRPDQAIPLLYGASAHQIARSLGTDLPPKTCVQLCQGGGGRPASARLAAPRITRPDVFCPSPASG